MTTMDVHPVEDVERGSPYDQADNDIVFSLRDQNIVELFDYGLPAPEDFKRMLRSDGVAQSLRKVLQQPILGAEWDIEPTGEQEIDDEVRRQLFEPCVDGGMETSLQTVIAQMTGAFIDRRSYFEKVWTPDGSKVRLKKLAWRPPGSCILQRDAYNGDVRGFKQVAYPISFTDRRPTQDGYIPIPEQYAFVYVHGVEQDPVRGVSDFEVPYWCWTTKQKVLYLWFTYLESQSLQRTILRGKDGEQVKKAAQAVAALRNSGVVGIPEDWVSNIDMMNPGGGSASAQFEAAIKYLDSQASRSALAGFLDLTSHAGSSGGGGGSYALSSDQSDLFLQTLKGYADEIADAFTNYVLADIVRYNFGKQAPVPRFKFGELTAKPIKDEIQMLTTLASATNLNVPLDFVQQLVLNVGHSFGMDLSALQDAIDQKSEEAAATQKTQQLQQLAQLAATATTGAQAVAQAQAGPAPVQTGVQPQQGV